jgi:hypothetical protein
MVKSRTAAAETETTQVICSVLRQDLQTSRFGRDAWFSCLEVALIASGAWPHELPDEYEVR